MPANYSITTRSDGETLTAAKYNADHQNHIDKGTPTYHDDYSENLAQMRSQVNPGAVGSESLATTLAGELERIRYSIAQVKAAIDPTITYWYDTAYGTSNFFNVKAYGATGDGSTDDTTAVQAALTALQTSGGTLIFPPGTYRYTSTLTLTNCTGFGLVSLGGATLKAGNGTSTSVGGLTFTNCDEGYIHGLIIDGNRANRTPVVGQGLPGIYILENCTKLLFNNVLVKNTIFDNWYLGNTTPASQTPPTDIIIHNCISENAHRNGLAIVSGIRISVIGGFYRTTNGTAPQAGIDVEPDAGQTVTDVILSGVTCSSNTAMGIQVGGSNPLRVSILDCRGSANGDGLLAAGSCTNLRVKNLTGDTYSTAPTRAVVDFGSGLGSLDVDGIHLDNLTFNSATKYGIYFHSNITYHAIVRNVTITNFQCGALYCAKTNTYFENLAFLYCTSGPTLNVQIDGDNCIVKNLHMRACAGIQVTLTGTDIVLDGVSIIDMDASASTCLYLYTGSDYAVLRNIQYYQNQNQTVGSLIYVAPGVDPLEFTNVNARCTGTGAWTTANVVNAASADMALCKVTNMTPDPYTDSATFDSGPIAAGVDYAFSITSTFARLGDHVSLASSVSLGTAVASGIIQMTGNVSSNGTITGFLSNNTPNSFNPGSQTVTSRIARK